MGLGPVAVTMVTRETPVSSVTEGSTMTLPVVWVRGTETITCLVYL